MKRILMLIALAAGAQGALAKLPPPTEAQKAKAEETSARGVGRQGGRVPAVQGAGQDRGALLQRHEAHGKRRGKLRRWPRARPGFLRAARRTGGRCGSTIDRKDALNTAPSLGDCVGQT